MSSSSEIPVTVLTGYLGSGKTTLLNRILSTTSDLRAAVIENEAGEVGIDQDLVIRSVESLIATNGGCVCCAVRDDLIEALSDMLKAEQPPEAVNGDALRALESRAEALFAGELALTQPGERFLSGECGRHIDGCRAERLFLVGRGGARSLRRVPRETTGFNGARFTIRKRGTAANR